MPKTLKSCSLIWAILQGAEGVVASFWLPTQEVRGLIPVSASPREVR